MAAACSPREVEEVRGGRAGRRMLTMRDTPRSTLMDSSQPHHHSQLFTVRLWLEDLGDGRTEWRGQVQQVISGETHYFREWSALIALLLAMVVGAETNPAMAVRRDSNIESHIGQKCR